MTPDSKALTDTDSNVSVQELKLLLSSILQRHANVRFRCVLEGEVWPADFMRILLVTEKGVILNEEKSNKTISIKFLNDIIQFELEKTYENYQAKSRYTITA